MSYEQPKYPTAREARTLANSEADSRKYDCALSEVLSALTGYASAEHGEQDATHGYYFLYEIGESRAAIVRHDWQGFVTLEEYGRRERVRRTYAELEAEYNGTYCEYVAEDSEADELAESGA